MVNRRGKPAQKAKETSEVETDIEELNEESDQYLTGETEMTEDNTEEYQSEEETEEINATVVPVVPNIIVQNTGGRRNQQRQTTPRPRRSSRLAKKKTPNTTQADNVETEDTESQGDNLGLYGMIKGAIHDMTKQVVSAIQTA